jgi:hypothetical protein
MDMLVKLYELKRDPALDSRMTSQAIVIRRVLAPELPALTAWIEPRFGAGWAAEATAATMRQPTTCFIAIQADQLIGFACHEATAKGFFGPTGVDQAPAARASAMPCCLKRCWICMRRVTPMA